MIKKIFLFALLLSIANLESHEFNPAHLIINQNNDEELMMLRGCIQ